MTLERLIARARKSTAVGLTPEEKEEQATLRGEYLDAVRRNLRAQLDNIDIKEPDGRIVNLGELHKEKYTN